MNSITFDGRLDEEREVKCECCGVLFKKSIRNLRKTVARGRKIRCRPCWLKERGQSKSRNAGYKSIDSQGYVRMRTETGWEREHRRVAEQKIGRPLNVNEEVHHINGVKHDNRPENLEVLSRVDHQHAHHLGKPRDNKTKMKIAISVRSVSAKLSLGDVFLIKELLSEGMPKPKIAKRFSVTNECIYNIANGKSWRSYE